MPSAKSEPKRLPIFEGLFESTSQDPRLLGSKCKECGAVSFPRSLRKHRPECVSHEAEDIRLSRRGILRSYTILHYQPPELFKGPDPFEPYAIGSLELMDGIEVFGIIKDCAFGDLKIDMPMEIIFDKLYSDPDGTERLTWKFRPAKA